MLLIDQDGPIRRLTLNRPEVRNAFNDELIATLTQAFQEAAADSATRFVLLAGAGPAFCAGADLQWMVRAADYTADENRRDARRLSALFHAILDCSKPVIARVHGAAFGGATGLIAACDVVVAEESTRFAFSEIKLGILPAVISPFVIRRIGPIHARHYFLTGSRFDAHEALRIQLVDRIAPSGELDSAIAALTRELLSSAPQAATEVAALVDRVAGQPPRSVEADLVDWIARLRAAPEGREGMRAFLERRPAFWVPGAAKE
jgi:methylglutaconyl-CoA hydratase